MMTYGLPYKGSKNAIAQWVVDHLPPAAQLYDLFAGGCAVTHAALLSGKFGEVYANDIQGDVLQLFLDAINGRYRDEKRWISRDHFNRMRDVDAYVRICWSFGNNGRDYLYNKDVERLKHCGWNFLFSETFEDRMAAYSELVSEIRYYATRAVAATKAIAARQQDTTFVDEAPTHVKNRDDYVKGQNRSNIMRPLIDYFLDAKEKSGFSVKQISEHLDSYMASHYFTKKSQWSLPTAEAYAKLQEIMPSLTRNYTDLRAQYDLLNGESLARLQSLQSLQSLESLQRLQRLQRLEELQSQPTISAVDYSRVNIAPNSVIYCDPPYRNTTGYVTGEFDHDSFYEWALRQTQPVFISEYAMPDDFVEIATKSKMLLYSSDRNSKTIERLFIPRHQAAVYRKPGQLF